jgi:hypothetical protein
VKLSRCRSCDAPIVWTVTAKGKSMPVDADPVIANRGFRLDAHDGDEVRAAFTAMPDAGEKLYQSHFAACEQAATWRQTMSRTAWDSLIAVVTAYVNDPPVLGGDSVRAIVLAAIDRLRAALERPRPAPPEPTFADNRGIVGALQDLQGTGAPPKRDYKLFLASGEALYGSKQAVQEAHWAIWRAEPTTTCTGQTYRDFAERCDRARQEAEQRAADATKLANELAGGSAGTGAAPPDRAGWCGVGRIVPPPSMYRGRENGLGGGLR